MPCHHPVHTCPPHVDTNGVRLVWCMAVILGSDLQLLVIGAAPPPQQAQVSGFWMGVSNPT